jgi:hypothetical protein
MRVAELSFTQVFMTWCLIVDDVMFTFYFRRKKAGRLHKSSSSSFEANHAAGCQLVTGKVRVQSQGSEIIVDKVTLAQILLWTLWFSSESYYSAIFSILLSIICVMVSGPNKGRRSRDSLTSSYENTKYKIPYFPAHKTHFFPWKMWPKFDLRLMRRG